MREGSSSGSSPRRSKSPVAFDMAYVPTDLSFDKPLRSSLGPVVGLSITFHVVVFLIIPLAAHMLRRPQKFVRPRTFQLVQPPHTQQPKKVPPKPKPPSKPASSTKPRVKPKPKPKKPKPVPAKAKPSKAKPQPKEENVDDLAALLEALPAPAEVAVLNPDFNYNYYDNFVRRKIEQYWNPPSERPGMSVVVKFDILTSGRAVNISITESSGDPSLDNLALRAVKLASPFGKLPVKYRGQRVTYRVTLIPVRK